MHPSEHHLLGIQTPVQMPRHFVRSLAVVLGLMVMNFGSVAAQTGTIATAQQLLALKQGELNTFVIAVETNAQNCDALTGCSSTTGCSRLSCYEYGTSGDPNYKCLPVANNTFCRVSQSSPMCLQRNFDFTKAFVRRVDPIDDHIRRTVCSQRFLDDHFKNSTMNDPSHFFRAFFGSVDGTMRIYPGLDEPCDSPYDPRIRPWYLESTYIPKVVAVVIDSGLSMRGAIGGSDGEMYFDKAIVAALSVLDTLEEDEDFVSFACFDGAGLKPLGNITRYNKARMYQAFNDSLVAVKASPSISDSNSTHTNAAINSTLTQLTTSNAIPANYLKVVIAFIGGQQYDDISDLNVTAVPVANLFLYSFRKPLLPQCNPGLRASLEGVGDRLSNAGYTLQSYYSFLAKLHISFMGNQSDYGKQYPDYSAIGIHTLTISKAAFEPTTGELLGVVGIDIFEHLLEEQFPTIKFASIVEEARKHDPPRGFDTALDLNTNVCFDHTDVCAAASGNVQEFLCAMANSPDINIGCCGSCRGTTSSPTSKTSKLRLILGVVGGVVGLLVLLAILVAYLHPRPPPPPPPPSPPPSSPPSPPLWSIPPPDDDEQERVHGIVNGG